MKKVLLMATAAASLMVPWAKADIEVRIIGAFGDTGWQTCGSTNVICPTGPTGQVTLGAGTVSLGSATNTGSQNVAVNPLLDLGYTAKPTDLGAGNITFEVLATNYNVPFLGSFIGANGNSSIGDPTISFASYVGNNTECAIGSVSCDVGAGIGNLNMTQLSSGSTADLPNPPGYTFTSSTSGPSTSNPYSLALVVTLNGATRAGTASGDVALDAVPEPASVVLTGGLLLFVGARLRRKFAKPTPTV